MKNIKNLTDFTLRFDSDGKSVILEPGKEVGVSEPSDYILGLVAQGFVEITPEATAPVAPVVIEEEIIDEEIDTDNKEIKPNKK